MVKTGYVIWESDDNFPGACVLDKFEGVDREWELNKGVSRAVGWPEDATFTMHPDFPYNTLLTDNLVNVSMMIVASRRLKEFLEARALKQVEYLPVTIIDHKERTASRDYFIVHPVDSVDCLDIDKCGAKWSKLDTESIQNLECLVIDESKVDSTREIFRPKHFYDITLVRRELGEAIDREGFTGIRWIELNDYPE